MNIKSVAFAVIIFASISSAASADTILSSYSQAVASGPFNTADTGTQQNIPIAQAQSPDTTIYYDQSTGQYNSVGGDVSQIGGAKALANLLVGQVRAGAGTTVHVTGYPVFAWNAAAAYGDTLLFTNPNAGPSTITNVGFSVHITGTLGDIPGGNTTSSGQPNVQFGLAFGPAGGASYVPQSFNQSAVNMVNGVSVVQSWYGDLGVLDQTLTGTFSFTGNAAIIPVAESLYVSGQYGYADVFDTATFSFDPLPNGVSFTSASGEFLAAAVPEPSTWAMMILGFFGVGFLAYRRKGSTIRFA